MLRGRKRDGESTAEDNSWQIIPLPDDSLSFSIDTAMHIHTHRDLLHFFVVSFMIQSYFSRDGAICVC